MAEINSVSIPRDVVLFMRDLISGTIPDPLSNRQTQSGDAGSNARFVMTSWPERAVAYPLITVTHVSATDQRLGISTTDALMTNRLQVDVWSKQKSMTDGLTGSIYYTVRNSALTTAVASGLFTFRLAGMRNLDEIGKGGIHRKSIDVEYDVIAHS